MSVSLHSLYFFPQSLCFIILRVFLGHGASCCFGPAGCLLATLGKEILWLAIIDFISKSKSGSRDHNGFWINTLHISLDLQTQHTCGLSNYISNAQIFLHGLKWLLDKQNTPASGSLDHIFLDLQIPHTEPAVSTCIWITRHPIHLDL